MAVVILQLDQLLKGSELSLMKDHARHCQVGGLILSRTWSFLGKPVDFVRTS